MATVLMYLSDVEEGGETAFSASVAKPHAGDPAYSPCGQSGVSMKPKKGNAIFFWSTDTKGVEDPASLHASCPVIKVSGVSLCPATRGPRNSCRRLGVGLLPSCLPASTRSCSGGRLRRPCLVSLPCSPQGNKWSATKW